LAEAGDSSRLTLPCNPRWKGAAARRGKEGLRVPKQRQGPTAPNRPVLEEVSQFIRLEREVEIEYRPRLLEALQGKVNAVADSVRDQTPSCSQCGQPMKRQDTESVSWTAGFGRLHASVTRYRCRACKDERRPLLDLLGVEPGRISGSLARLLALLAAVAPYKLAAQLVSLAVIGSEDRLDGCVAGGAAAGRSRGAIQRRFEPVSR